MIDKKLRQIQRNQLHEDGYMRGIAAISREGDDRVQPEVKKPTARSSRFADRTVLGNANRRDRFE